MRREIYADSKFLRQHGISQEQVARIVDTATAKFSEETTDPLLIDFHLAKTVVRVGVRRVSDHLEIAVIPSPEKMHVLN